MSEIKIGDRVKVVGWPVDDPDIDNKDGEVVTIHRNGYIIVKLDDPPGWLDAQATRGLYCKPEELELISD